MVIKDFPETAYLDMKVKSDVEATLNLPLIIDHKIEGEGLMRELRPAA